MLMYGWVTLSLHVMFPFRYKEKYPKENNMLYSIITVCFNNPEELRKTLTSIDNQNYFNKEVIVINGGDKANIAAVVESFQSLAITFVSEPDQGIYDAMNKGARLANGQYVIYLNSGDAFCDSRVLNKVEAEIDKNPNLKIVYAPSISDYGYKQVLCKAKSSDEFLKPTFYELGFSHQSIFVCKDVLGTRPFDLEYKVAADFKFLYPNLRKHNKDLLQLDFPVSIFATGGVSDLDKTILNIEKKKIYFINNPYNIAAAFHFGKIILLEKLKKRLRPIVRRNRF